MEGRSVQDEGSVDDAVRQLWVHLGPEQRRLARHLADHVAQARAEGDLASWRAAHAAAHRLAGTLGSFGQHAAGREALAIEQLTAGDGAPDSDRMVRVSAHAVALLEHLDA
jgi:HPt (histidine-containing phosphotransfer) domain-containing protein